MRVRIYQPAKSATQSRCGCGGRWRIEPVEATPRTLEPLMGWESAQDPLSCLKGQLTFATQGEALTFARQRGWDYELTPANPRKVTPKNYVDNFNPDRRKVGRS